MQTLLRAAAFVIFTMSLGDPATAQTSNREGRLSAPAFTELFVKALRTKAPDAAVKRVGPLHLKVGKGQSGPGEGQYNVYLDNAFTLYRNDPESQDAIIGQYIAGLLEAMASPDVTTDVSRIVPVIKDAQYIADLRRSSKPGKGGTVWIPAYERLNRHLIVLYAEKRSRNMGFLTEKDLVTIGFSKKGRRARAVKNLQAILPKIKLYGRDGTYMLSAGGTYEASLLLFSRIWRSGKIKVKGEIVVSIPARDMLMATGSKDPKGLEKIKQIAAKVMQNEPYRLTDRLFVYRKKRFVAFDG